MAVEEAIAQSAIGSRGDFPGPLFIAVAPIEIEWQQRQELAQASRTQRDLSYDDLLRSAARRALSPFSRALPVRLGRRQLRGEIRHQGLADLALDRLRVRRERHPARRGGDPARRNRGGALHRDRRFGQCGKPDPLFAALGAVDPERSARRRLEAILQESRRLRHGGRRRRAGAGEPRQRAARGATILGVIEGCGELADSFHRTRSSPDGKPIIGCMRNAIADAGLTPEDIDYINAHGTGTPENDKMECLAVTAVFGEHAKAASDFVEQIDDRTHALGGGRGRVGLQPADARSAAHSTDHQLRGARSDDSARRRAERGA